MKIPFHTENCREGWGCLSSCPVVHLKNEYLALEAELKAALHAAETWETAYKETQK
jgi:hypothetical protein